MLLDCKFMCVLVYVAFEHSFNYHNFQQGKMNAIDVSPRKKDNEVNGYNFYVLSPRLAFFNVPTIHFENRCNFATHCFVYLSPPETEASAHTRTAQSTATLSPLFLPEGLDAVLTAHLRRTAKGKASSSEHRRQ